MLVYCPLTKNIKGFKEAMCHNAKLLVVFMSEARSVTLFSFRKQHHYMRDGMTCQKWLDNLKNGSFPDR